MSEFTEAVEAIPDMGEEDWENVILGLARGMDKDGGFTEETQQKLEEWVSKTLIDFVLLGMLCKGILDVEWNEELEDWGLKLNDIGEQEAEKVIVDQFIESLDEPISQ